MERARPPEDATSGPSFADIGRAARRLAGLSVVTPLLRADALDAACGAKVFVKAESLQRTGSFKFRGAYNRLRQLSAGQREHGVVAFSSGNHAQGIADAARLVGCPAMIVMPDDAPRAKIDGVRALGAEIVFYDRHTEDREAIAAELARTRRAVLVPSYDDADVIAGQGTAGLEAARQLRRRGTHADDLVCPVSGGGLLAGISLAFEALSPRTRLWSAEPAGFDDHAKSLRTGERVVNAPGGRSLADALLAPTPGRLTWPINRARSSGGVVVDDAQIRAAMAFSFRHLKLVLEPGGATALAAALAGVGRGGTLLVIASGGNVDPSTFREAIACADQRATAVVA